MIVDIVLPLSLAFIMFALGLGLTIADFTRILVMPKAVLTGLVMQVFGLPLLVFTLLQFVSMPPEMAFGFMLLSFCPGGFTSAILTRLAGGTVALSITLTAIVSLISVVSVPLLVAWAAGVYLQDFVTQIDITSLGIAMFALTVVPVILGMLLRGCAVDLAGRIEKPMNSAALVIFIVVVVAAILSNWQVFTDNVFVLGPFAALIAVIALSIGILLARLLGVTRPDAVCISIELGVQNSTLGIAVAGLISAGAGLSAFAIPAATYGVLMYIVTLPAIAVMRRFMHRET